MPLPSRIERGSCLKKDSFPLFRRSRITGGYHDNVSPSLLGEKESNHPAEAFKHHLIGEKEREKAHGED
jgi:hypothetical protein